MTVAHLVNRNYAVLDAYGPVNASIVKRMIGAGVVLMDEDNSPIGVLTSADLANKKHILAVDCLTPKPRVDCMDSVEKVLALMVESGCDVLPAYDNNMFLGTISHWDIMRHVYARYDRQNIALQGVIHDLKSPINSIKMVVDILDQQTIKEENKEMIRLLRMTCEQAEILIHNILQTENVSETAMTMDRIFFDDIVVECSNELMAFLQKKSISVDKRLHFGNYIKGDKNKLKRAIHNVLSNSIKFCKSGGHIILSSYLEDEMLVFCIEDDGIGIPREVQDNVFDKFTVAKRPGTNGEPSTGLGLYLCSGILKAHKGEITIDSDGSCGTTVRFFLPVEK